jgi:prepilin-type N-terminal cleavage/methylation domain-containing protein
MLTMRQGFTLIELIIIIGILAILMAVVLPNFTTPVRRTSFSEALNVFVSDAKTQQHKAMMGDSQLAIGPKPYGIFITSTGYILFQGPGYTDTDPHNFSVNFDPNLNFTFINLPQTQIDFAAGSGAASNFVSDSYSVTLVDLETGQSSVITFNRYGVITQVI